MKRVFMRQKRVSRSKQSWEEELVNRQQIMQGRVDKEMKQVVVG